MTRAYLNPYAAPPTTTSRSTPAATPTSCASPSPSWKSLDPDVFFRVHRSAIVNLARIREIHPMFHGDSMLVLSDGSQVKLSRSRRGEFERVFSAAR